MEKRLRPGGEGGAWRPADPPGLAYLEWALAGEASQWESDQDEPLAVRMGLVADRPVLEFWVETSQPCCPGQKWDFWC